MIRRTTWVLLAIFVVLLGVLLYLQRNPLNLNEDETPTPTVALLSIDQNQINKLQVRSHEGNQVAFIKTADGAWELVDPPGKLGSDSVVQSMLNRLGSLSALSTLSGQVQDETLGLNPPRYMLIASTSAGQEQVLNIGVQTPTGSGYYLRVNDGPVYVVSQSSVDTLLTPLTDPSSIATTTPKTVATPSAENTPGATPASTP
jgi:hypothetical protein